jgi:hypothetical protein
MDDLGGAVFCELIGSSVLPCSPEDADTSSREDRDGMSVLAAAPTCSGVDGSGPGGRVPGVVGGWTAPLSKGDGLPQVLVAGPPENDAAASAGGAGDRADIGFGGELVEQRRRPTGLVAVPAVAALGQDLRGADAARAETK